MRNILKKIRFNLKEYALNLLLKETGIDISPEPNIWGSLSSAEKLQEEQTLANLHENKMWGALMRKYAEGANKAMTQAVRLEKHSQALRYNAQFFTYASMILKAKRAYEKHAKKSRDKIRKSNV